MPKMYVLKLGYDQTYAVKPSDMPGVLAALEKLLTVKRPDYTQPYVLEPEAPDQARLDFSFHDVLPAEHYAEMVAKAEAEQAKRRAEYEAEKQRKADAEVERLMRGTMPEDLVAQIDKNINDAVKGTG